MCPVAGNVAWKLLVLLPLCVGVSRSAAAQAPPQTMDRLVLADDAVVEGLLLRAGDRTVEFAQIQRPPGRPMQAVIRPYPRAEVSRIEQAPAASRGKLAQQFQELRNRAAIEADQINQITLAPAEPPDLRTFADAQWVYDGEWFQLLTSLPPAAARQVIVRVEQVFRAYRHLLPPERRPPRTLQIVVAGNEGEYRRLLLALDLDTASPAVYLPRRNQILASTQLSTLARRIADVQDAHDRLAKEQQRKIDRFSQQFVNAAADLAKQGFTPDEIVAEKRARQAALQRETDALATRIDAANRRNAQAFASASHEAMRRLYHEAFHAYLEGYYKADATRELPRWLNEGLAQVFEYAQLDGGHLRIDAAPEALLDSVRRDLPQRPLPLSRVLEAGATDFHGREDPQLARRLYTYAWGIAFYLTFHEGKTAESLLRDLDGRPPDAEGLPGLVKQDSQWWREARWRNALLSRDE